MLEASITPGMARTRFNRSSESMVAPTILCRWSERRGAPVGAGLRVAHFPRGPPGTCGSREDPDVIAVRLDPEDLVTPGPRLPDLDLLSVLVPESRHYSLHRKCL